MADEMNWPLRGWEAVEAEAPTARQRKRFYTPVYPALHIPRGVEVSAAQRAIQAWLWSRRRGVVAGLSAAAMPGAKLIGPALPAKLVHTTGGPRRC